jgi:hypothetical protein
MNPTMERDSRLLGCLGVLRELRRIHPASDFPYSPAAKRPPHICPSQLSTGVRAGPGFGLEGDRLGFESGHSVTSPPKPQQNHEPYQKDSDSV